MFCSWPQEPLTGQSATELIVTIEWKLLVSTRRIKAQPGFEKTETRKQLFPPDVLLWWGEPRPQVSLRVPDVPEVSRAEMHVATGGLVGGTGLRCAPTCSFSLGVVRVKVFYSVVTWRIFGVLQSFVYNCPAFACSVFQVIKTNIKTINKCADSHTPSFRYVQRWSGKPYQ